MTNFTFLILHHKSKEKAINAMYQVGNCVN